MFNVALISGLWAVFIAQWMKLPLLYYKKGIWDWKIILSTGSMPSSHTAFVVSTTTAIGIIDGFSSTVFAIAAVFTLITIHDAVKVRGESGKQAAVLNEIVGELQLVFDSLDLSKSKIQRDKKLKELIGHTTTEIIGGIIVGILTAIVFLKVNNVL